MSNADFELFHDLKAEIESLRHRNRKLECENSRLRAMTGCKRRKSRKSACIENYKEGMTGQQLATLSDCSVRYANQVIAILKG